MTSEADMVFTAWTAAVVAQSAAFGLVEGVHSAIQKEKGPAEYEQRMCSRCRDVGLADVSM